MVLIINISISSFIRDKKDVAAQTLKLMFVGEVISDKMNKTVVVKTEQSFKHPEFNKIVRKVKTYKVHDEQEEASRCSCNNTICIAHLVSSFIVMFNKLDIMNIWMNNCFFIWFVGIRR